MLCLFCFALGRVVDEFSKSSSVEQAIKDAEEFRQEITAVLDTATEDLHRFANYLQDHLNHHKAEALKSTLNGFQQDYRTRAPYRRSYQHISRIDQLKSSTAGTQSVRFDFSVMFDQLPDSGAQLKLENLFRRYKKEINLHLNSGRERYHVIVLDGRSSQTTSINEDGNQFTFHSFDQSWLIKSNSELYPQGAYLRFKSTFDKDTKRFELDIQVRQFNL